MRFRTEKRVKRKGIPENKLTKREFLKFCGTTTCALCAAHLFGFPKDLEAQRPQKGLIKTKLSPYFTSMTGGYIRCELCPNGCLIPEGKTGACKVRKNQGGRCFSLVYGNPCILHLDPIEKDSFLHVLPGTNALTISTAGCNFHCKFCENWESSQASPEDVFSYDAPPGIVVNKAKEMNVRSIAYTYVEPVIYYEYMYDIAGLAKKAGLLNLIHSNGFINQGPLRNLCKVLDAAQIDLKGFSETFYREMCSGRLAPVLETMRTLKNENVHLEITNLIIPTKNDDMLMVKKMCTWIRRELGPDTPVHFSRFYPLYLLQRLPPTPVSMLEKARTLAYSSGLKYVYIGKVPGHEAWNSYCPECRKIILRRTGYMIGDINMDGGKCGYCGTPIPGIWS